MTTTITTASPHGIKVGDTILISSTAPDTQWWALLWSWLLRRPPPMRTVVTTLRVSDVGWTWVAGEGK